MKSSGKLALGMALGLAIGSAIVYFSSRDNRRSFIDGMGNMANKTRDSIMDGYNEAKERYYEYRDKVKEYSGRAVDQAEEIATNVANTAREYAGKIGGKSE